MSLTRHDLVDYLYQKHDQRLTKTLIDDMVVDIFAFIRDTVLKKGKVLRLRRFGRFVKKTSTRETGTISRIAYVPSRTYCRTTTKE